MLVKTKGIVLNTVKYADNASIVTVYTYEYGRISFVARGLYSKKSKLRAALLQALSIVEIDLDYKPKKELQYIKDIRIAIPFTSIPFNPVKTSLVLFMAEVMYKVLKHPVQDIFLYQFLEESICNLDVCEIGLGNFHLFFLSGLAMQMGFAPELSEDKENRFFDLLNGEFISQRPQHLHYIQDKAAQNFKDLMELNFDNLSSISLSRKERAESLDFFIEYFKLHIPDFYTLKSVDVMYKLWD